MELYRKVRLACRDGMSERAAARHFGVSRESVRKMLEFSVPPGYRRTAPVRRPKLDGFTGLIERWLRPDNDDPPKQRHTAKRIFERLRDEHGFTGGYTIVKDYVRDHRRRRREMFVPLVHSPGHAQADFGEAWAFIGGVKQKVHFFAFDLPHSDASYVRAYVDRVVIGCGAEIIARHRRSYEGEDMVFDPLHYLSLIERKIGALDQAAPLARWELPDAFGTLRRLMEARSGRAGRREYVQVLRLLEAFGLEDVHGAVKHALRLGAIGFDAVKHLVLCRVEKRPPRLDLDVYPYLPRANVGTTCAASYLCLMSAGAQ